MRRNFLAFFLITFFVISCKTSITPPSLVLSFDESTVGQLQENLDSGQYLQVLQDIDTFQREYPEHITPLVNELWQQAKEQLEHELDSALAQERYDDAQRALKSLIALTRGPQEGIISEQQLVARITLEKLSGETPVAGIIYNTVIQSQSYNNPEIEPLLVRVESEEGYRSQTDSAAGLIPAVVTLWVDRGIRMEEGVGVPDIGIGSGFFIDHRGYLLTNYHVIQSEVDPEYEGYSRLYIRLESSSGRRVPARVVGWDPIFDIALVKTELQPEAIIPFVLPPGIEQGMPVFAIGSPGGLGSTLTQGILSSVERPLIEMGYIYQADVPINEGNSGGPLLDSGGNLVGVNFAGANDFEGVNFSLPVSWLSPLIPQMYEGGRVVHPWLGTVVYNPGAGQGIEVLYSVPGSPARSGGLRRGDRLISLNGLSFETIEDFQYMLLNIRPDTLVRIDWIRDSQQLSGLFCLKERPLLPMEQGIQTDLAVNLLPALFGLDVITAGTSSYQVENVLTDTPGDFSGITEGDILEIRDFEYLDEYEAFILLLYLKQKKNNYIETRVILPSGIRLHNIL